MAIAPKQRIQVSLSQDAKRFLPLLAKKRRIPAATLASTLIDEALELQEDLHLSKLADERFSQKNIRWVSHETVWKKRIGKSSTTKK